MIACLAFAAAFITGCAAKRDEMPPIPDASGGLSSLSVPLEVKEFEVVDVGGYRGIFLKLSRLPDSVAHFEQSDPASIVIEIKGPTGGESPEEAFTGGDTLVQRVRVARTFGSLQVAIDFADDPPSYTVHTMADWIMVRFTPQG